MSFKLVVSNTVEFPVKFTLNDAGKLRAFSFTLLAERMSADELRESATGGEGAEAALHQLLLDRITGWRGQGLVVDDSGQPADFSREGMELVLGLLGVRALVLEAFVGACSDKGRAKN